LHVVNFVMTCVSQCTRTSSSSSSSSSSLRIIFYSLMTFAYVLSHKFWQSFLAFRRVMDFKSFTVKSTCVTLKQVYVFVYTETRVYELEPPNLSESDTISCILSTLKKNTTCREQWTSPTNSLV